MFGPPQFTRWLESERLTRTFFTCVINESNMRSIQSGLLSSSPSCGTNSNNTSRQIGNQDKQKGFLCFGHMKARAPPSGRRGPNASPSPAFWPSHRRAPPPTPSPAPRGEPWACSGRRRCANTSRLLEQLSCRRVIVWLRFQREMTTSGGGVAAHLICL